MGTHCTSHRGLFENLRPRRVASGTASPCTILVGGCWIRSSHTALACSSRCGFAKAMRRNMTYPWHMFFLSGRGVLFCAQRGTCAVLFEFTAVMLCVPGVATFFKGSSCCSHDQLGWTARAGKNAASV